MTNIILHFSHFSKLSIISPMIRNIGSRVIRHFYIPFIIFQLYPPLFRNPLPSWSNCSCIWFISIFIIFFISPIRACFIIIGSNWLSLLENFKKQMKTKGKFRIYGGTRSRVNTHKNSLNWLLTYDILTTLACYYSKQS